jgi:hypothetical protein
VRVSFVFALLGVVAGIGEDPEKAVWDAVATFCVHVIGAIAFLALGAVIVVAPVLGVMLIYRRLRFRYRVARLRRRLPAVFLDDERGGPGVGLKKPR